MHLPPLLPSSAVKLQFKWSRRTGGLVLFSILYFSTCQVLIDWLRWIRIATLLQRVCERAAYIYIYKCVYVCVQSSRVHAGCLWTDNEQHLILRSLTSSPSTSSFHPRQLLSGPGMIWILIVFLQPPANVAVGGRKGGHNETIPSHMQRIWGWICLLQQWQEQSVLWGQFRRKKKKNPSVYSGLRCGSPLKI